ncbi:MAG TPA: ABC transporter ATP-binding protein [Acidimicrobiales bacterium]|nr:ABC transporter ATP-binding protein [Acidimicrobiales bacterium]
MAETPVVELSAVRRAFGAHIALDGLSFAATPGTVTVLLGPNGAGKTTAVRVITGALRADAGTVRTFGLDPAADGAAVRQRCGVVAAKPALYDRLSGWDNLVYAAELYGLGPSAPIEESAARFGIEDALGLRVGGYSTGMKTRLALARAVLHNPDLLLLDEPTSGLDPESSRAVLHLIDELAAQGRTVIMCTHLLLEAEGLADQVVMLDGGRALVAGPPDELVRQVWPRPWLVVDAEDRASLHRLAAVPGVVSVHAAPDGPWRVELDGLARVPDLVAELAFHGVRLTRVAPHEPSLEELYFALRGGPTGAPVLGEPVMPRVRVA